MSEIKNKWIWPFEMIEKLGEGGMGVVYRARYVKNDRNVAVKILPDDVADPIILGRFDRELEILRKLRHPNIVHCFGGTTEGKHRFYAMEVIEGGSFDKLLARRGALPWEVVVKYAMQMAAGLEYAHAHKVTHRDVKPGNFLIAANGQLKLSDFGLATFSAARDLTAAGKTMGTFRYMAPEQIRGKEVGPRSDLYALGCVMYEMLVGHAPFDGETPAAILDQHLHKEAPRASASALDCPASLDLLISTLLQKDAEKRPASAHEVSEKLAQISPVATVSGVIRPHIETTAEVDVPKPAKSPLNVWNVPVWMAILALLAPLFLAGWTVQVQRQSREAEIAIASWKTAWTHENVEVKKVAAESLGLLAPQDEAALELLAGDLNAQEPKNRELSLIGLANAGPAAGDYLGDIQKLQREDPEPSVRNQAAATIENIKNGPHFQKGWGLWVLIATGILVIGGYLFARRKFGET